MILSFRKEDPVDDIPEICIGKDESPDVTCDPKRDEKKSLRDTKDSYLPPLMCHGNDCGVTAHEASAVSESGSSAPVVVMPVIESPHALPSDPFRFIEAEPVVDDHPANLGSHAMSPTLRTALLSFSSTDENC